eukprot:CAMPEP_0168350554 /NCGR_PEP_ID=MMETSP0213-20121227/21205_1 /TAXON_ID=151035 /ORGANISM="Euplotes harpa, Strain FSP1.4" /LENGTH=329 /DNA_ID=CAMNT_0008360957 /DNA_START=91 /DNA_END=1080 /DNA_ORIENTATION=-
MKNEMVTIKSLPRVLVFSKGTFFLYEKGVHLDLFLHFVNRHLYPIVQLTSKASVEAFRDTSLEWEENTPFYKGKYRRLKDIFPTMDKVTRVIVFITQKSEFKYEMKQITEAALKLGYRDDLRIAKVTDKEIVNEYKNTMREKWFDHGSVNSMVVINKGKSPQDPVNVLDLSGESVNFEHWINSASIEPVEELSPLSLQIMEPMYMPIFAAFVDKNYKIKGASFALIKKLNELALEFPQYLFGYFKEHVFDERKSLIGINWNTLPAFGLYNPPEDKYVVFPKDVPMTKQNLKRFLEHGITSAMKNITLSYNNPSEEKKESKDQHIKKEDL